MPQLIGLNGKARSGKDTTADLIQSWCNANNFSSARHGFADKLKESAAHSVGVFEDEIEFCNELKAKGTSVLVVKPLPGELSGSDVISAVTGREFLQYYGTEAHREVFGSDFWVDSLLPNTQENFGKRFEEEVIEGNSRASFEPLPDWWKNFRAGAAIADFCLVTDVRFDNEAERIIELGGSIWRIVRDGSGAGEHASEQELPGELVSITIDNNGTLNDLSESVETIMADVPHLEIVSNG